MDATSDAAIPKIKFKNGQRTCSVCQNPGKSLFQVPSDESRYNRWFSALKWSVSPEKLKYVLKNARVCDKHFSDSCFSSTLRRRLIKFACPHITDDASPTVIATLQSRSSPVFQSTSNEAIDTPPSISNISPPNNTSSHLQVTPKTRKIKTLLSCVSKFRKRLYEKRTSSPLMGQLQAKLADKPYLYEFIACQLRMQCRSTKGRRWSSKEKSFALEIYLHSPSAYKILRKYFAFPSKATLHRYTYNVAKASGFCPNLVKCLKTQCSQMSESEKLCVLLIDEMSIKPGYSYAKDLDSIDGFTTVQFQKEIPPLATHALVFMARGIVKNWKQVLGYYFTNSSEKFNLKNLVYEAIDILQSCELEVVSLISDQGPNNQGLFRDLKITRKAPYFLHNSKKIYAMYDPPHLLKSVRNNMKNHGIYFVKETESVEEEPKTEFADWNHIRRLYDRDSKDRFSSCRRLTRSHVEVSGLKKMNVKLAAQVLSASVASSLKLYAAAGFLDNKAKATAEFVLRMDKLFDSVNARSLSNSKKECLALTQDSYVEFWKEIIPWIDSWNVFSSTTGRRIVPPCKNGWIITLNAFIQISEFLLKKLNFILTNRFNQDPLENTFATVRRRGGFRDNPDANEFRSTMHKIVISNFLKETRGKNCKNDDAASLIDFTSFNKKEILNILNSGDSGDESVQHDVNIIQLTPLNIIEKNVLSYISGYLAKKFLSSNECVNCRKLLLDEDKDLDNHTLLLYFKEYENCKYGLKWPTQYLLEYFVKLHESFESNFMLFYNKKAMSQKFNAVLSKIDLDLFDHHIEHKDKAKIFFTSTFIQMMIKHNVRMMNDKISKNSNSNKKVKYL